MKITEVYHSIQGESTFAGLPCVFVRTTGCNLRCTWCDTEYAFFSGAEMSVEAVIDEVQQYGCTLVEITGGEPLLQKETPELAQRLLEAGYTVLVETSGERDVSVLDPRVRKIMDLKCPGSGEESRNRWANLAHLSPDDEIKFVIKDRADYDWTVSVLKEHNLEERCSILFSPVTGTLELADLAKWIVGDGLRVRFQLQLHKYIWPAATRRV